jgi:hypothetical protein
MKASNHKTKWSTIIPAIVAWGLLLGYGGYTLYQHQQDKQAEQAAQSVQANSSDNGTHRTGGIGKVTAISNNSISFFNQRESKPQTFAINKSTRITEAGKSKSYRDIHEGTLVLIWTRGTDTKTANLIVINPNMDGSARP